MPRKVIINADDFGMSEGTNHAVRRAAELGTISSTSIMVNMPFVEEIRDVAAGAPQLGLGLHLNLTQGKPLQPPARVSSLVDADGTFHSPVLLAKRALIGQVSLDEVKREVAAQVEAARGLVGERLDHWDSHQGSHRFEPLASVILATCRDLRVPAMRCHRHWFTTMERPETARTADITALGRFSLRRIATETYYQWIAHRAAAHFVLPAGLLNMPGSKTTALLRHVAQAGVPHEILEIPCHPATTTDGLWGTSMLDERVDEYECLVSPEFRAAVQSGRIELLSFAQLADRSGRRRDGRLAAATL